MTNHAIQQRRDAEFAKAATRSECDALQLRWQAEDQAILKAEDHHTVELRDLRDSLTDARARIRHLEWMLLSPDRKGLGEHIIQVIAKVIDKVASDIRKEIPKFLGVFEPGQVYKTNSVVTRQGALWVCLQETTTAPGTSTNWLMIAKSGKVE